MPTIKGIITIGVAAFFVAPALAKPRGDGHCTAVTYSTFESTRRGDEVPHLGPLGMYASTPDGDCLYVDASANSDFAKDYTFEYDSFMQNVGFFQSKEPQVADLPFLTSAGLMPRAADADPASEVLATLENRQVTCNSLCSSSQGESQRCVQCKCKYAFQTCINIICTVFYKCL